MARTKVTVEDAERILEGGALDEIVEAMEEQGVTHAVVRFGEHLRRFAKEQGHVVSPDQMLSFELLKPGAQIRAPVGIDEAIRDFAGRRRALLVLVDGEAVVMKVDLP